MKNDEDDINQALQDKGMLTDDIYQMSREEKLQVITVLEQSEQESKKRKQSYNLRDAEKPSCSEIVDHSPDPVVEDDGSRNITGGRRKRAIADSEQHAKKILKLSLDQKNKTKNKSVDSDKNVNVWSGDNDLCIQENVSKDESGGHDDDLETVRNKVEGGPTLRSSRKLNLRGKEFDSVGDRCREKSASAIDNDSDFDETRPIKYEGDDGTDRSSRQTKIESFLRVFPSQPDLLIQPKLVRRYNCQATDARPLITPDGSDWREHSKVILQYFNDWARRYRRAQSHIATFAEWGKPIDVKMEKPKTRILQSIVKEAADGNEGTEETDDIDKGAAGDFLSNNGNEDDSKLPGFEDGVVSRLRTRNRTIEVKAPQKANDDVWLSKDISKNEVSACDDKSDVFDFPEDDSDEDFEIKPSKPKKRKKFVKKPPLDDAKKISKYFAQADKGEKEADSSANFKNIAVNESETGYDSLVQYLTSSGTSNVVKDPQQNNVEARSSEDELEDFRLPFDQRLDSDSLVVEVDSENTRTVQIQVSGDESEDTQIYIPRVTVRPSINSARSSSTDECPMCLKYIDSVDYLHHVPRCVSQHE